MPRWIVRCQTCLAVSAIEEPATFEAKCGICDGPIESMGRVEADRLVSIEHRSPCDDRCTFARGNKCDCKCLGKHHGSKLVVRVVRDLGPVPIITPPRGREQARINAEEYTRHRAEALALLDRLSARRRAGEYLPRADFDRLRAVQAALRKGCEARDHKTRMRALRAVIGIVPPPDANPIAALAHAIEAAPKVAEAPFALAHQTASRPAGRQESLF